MDKTLKNAQELGIDLSAFHKPDRKWRNYYIEDKEQDLLFLVPSYPLYGVIVLDLSLASHATFITGDGAIHRLKDYTWGIPSNVRRTNYPKTTVTDRSCKSGRKTVLLNSILIDHNKYIDPEGRYAITHLNGNTYDNRLCNLAWGLIKDNNDKKYSNNIPKVKFPFKTWF
jgi:hypothetical protein